MYALFQEHLNQYKVCYYGGPFWCIYDLWSHHFIEREKQNNFDPLMAFRALIFPKAAIDTLMMAQYTRYVGTTTTTLIEQKIVSMK